MPCHGRKNWSTVFVSLPRAFGKVAFQKVLKKLFEDRGCIVEEVKKPNLPTLDKITREELFNYMWKPPQLGLYREEDWVVEKGGGPRGDGLTDQEAVIANAVRALLEALGEDSSREGLKDTPARVARMFVRQTFSGLFEDPIDIVKQGIFTDDKSELVIIKDIPFYSTCEHHLVPFYGKAHIGYIPRKRLLGLSKFARLVQCVAARPSIQERITNTVADLIDEHIEPEGVMVVIEAEHLCMAMRGARVPGAVTVTSAVRGAFRNVPAAREEFLALIRK